MSRDAVGGIATIFVATVYLNLAYQVRSSALDDTLSAGGMPKLYGWSMLGLGVLLFLQSVWNRQKWRAEDYRAEQWRGQGRSLVRGTGLLLLGIAYVLAVEPLGYLLTIFLLLPAVMIYLGALWGRRLLLVSFGGAMLLWLVFVKILNVKMPTGIFTTLVS